MKRAIAAVLLAAMALVGAGCQQTKVSVADIRAKERLTYEDILALAAARDLAFEAVEDEAFAEKWSFVASYATEDGDILLLSDYEGDLFARDKQAQELGWTEKAGSFWSILPTVAADAVTAFGDVEDYWYRAYKAKNILAYFVTPIPPEEKLVPPVTEEMWAELLQNLQIVQAVFLDDINARERGSVDKDLEHGKITIDFAGYQTPVQCGQVVQYDVYSSYQITLDFDEDFFAAHQGQRIKVIPKGFYADGMSYVTQPLYAASMTFGCGSQNDIVEFKQDSLHLTTTLQVIDDDDVVVYEETVECDV